MLTSRELDISMRLCEVNFFFATNQIHFPEYTTAFKHKTITFKQNHNILAHIGGAC